MSLPAYVLLCYIIFIYFIIIYVLSIDYYIHIILILISSGLGQVSTCNVLQHGIMSHILITLNELNWALNKSFCICVYAQ